MKDLLFSIDKTVLLVIDVQGNLAYRMFDKESLFRHIQALIQAAKIFNIPIVYTEQAPAKIGKTVPEIAAHMTGLSPIEKASFSCCGEEQFNQTLRKLRRKQILICGIETHVCVFQTTADVLSNGYAVQVVGDAVSSRTQENKNLALERMRQIGATITSTEMIMTELMRTSKHPKFREVLNLIR